MNHHTAIGFVDELHGIAHGAGLTKEALAPAVALLGADVGMAAADLGVGGYKAIRHGKTKYRTKLPYNPMFAAPWAVGKGLHRLSSPWAKSKSLPKKILGRAGLVGSKAIGATLQMDPVTALGSMAHSGVGKLLKKRRAASKLKPNARRAGALRPQG